MKSTFLLCFSSLILIFMCLPCHASIETCNDVKRCEKRCDKDDVCTCSRGCFMDLDVEDCTLYTDNPHLVYILQSDKTSMMLGMDLITDVSFSYFKQMGKSVMRNMDYDADTQTIYFIDVEKKAIFSYDAKSNTKDILLTYSDKKNSPLYIVWDWISRNLFLVDFLNIQVCDAQLRHCSTVYTPGTDAILQFALAPKARYMFWNYMVFNEGKLHRAEMDGSNEIIIKLSSIDKWHSFVIDHESERLYWIISEGNAIESSNFDGNKRQEFPIGKKSFGAVSEMSLINYYIYIVNKTQSAIIKCDFKIGDCEDVLELRKSDNLRIQHMTIMHKSFQPDGVNYCKSNNCDQLCVPNRLGYACKCSDDVRSRDGCQTRTVQLDKE